MLKKTFVRMSLSELVFAFSMFLPVQKISFIRSTVSPDFLAFSIGHIVEPVTHISVFLQIIDQDPFSLCNIVSDLSFVKGPSLENESAFALSISVRKCTIIIGAIRKIQLSDAMRLLIFPLTDINDVFIIDEMRSFWLASLFEERLVPDFVRAQSFGSFFNVAGELWLFLVRSVLL
jgi:hypothetical protein